APRIAMDEYKKVRVSGGVLTVDVRSEDSFRAGHIPGAMSVPLDQVDERAGEIQRAAGTHVVVTYCSCPAEHTSAIAALARIKAGLKDVRALVGGYPEWAAEGGAIEKDDREARD